MNVEKLFQQVMDEVCKDPLRRFAELVAADALAQPEQEPVAWMYVNEDGECEQIEYGVSTIEAPYIKLLYTAPPSKPWVGLENIDFQYQPPQTVLTMQFAEAILKEKNT